MDKTAELAGFFLAHAVWCIAGGETLIPLAGYEEDGARKVVRFEDERLEQGAEHAREWLETNPARVSRAVAIYDGFMTVGALRHDALIANAMHYGARRTLQILLPYSRAKGEQGFKVHRPKLTTGKDGGDDFASLAEALFRGVDHHAKGAEVWARHLDESV